MGRWLCERLTWKLLGLTIAFVVAAFWVMGRDIQIGGQAFDPEATGAFLLAGVALLWYLIPALSHWADKPIFGSSSSTIQKEAKSNADRNRADLLDAVDQIWLKGLLDNLLNQDNDFQIKLAYLKPEKVAQRYNGQPYPLKDNRAVLQTFEDFGRRLVLLGEPGAGKTVLLLQLARALHQIALDNKTAGIPVIFPLSSWAQKQLPFDEWLRGELRDRYGASPKLAETLVAGERLIYLLDGLDEVNAEQREACLQAIKTFVENPNRHIEYMLCSRQIEFVELQTRLNVPGEIVLQPLSWDAIQKYIQGNEFAALRALLDENTILREDFAPIPFMLNTMAYVTQGDSIEKARLALNGRTAAEYLRTYFLDAYVTKRLRARISAKYPADKTRHWLSWLALQMQRNKLDDFYLEDLKAMVDGNGIPVSDSLVWTMRKTSIAMILCFLIAGLTTNYILGDVIISMVLSLSVGLGFAVSGSIITTENLRFRTEPSQGISRSLRNGVLCTILDFFRLSALLAGLIIAPRQTISIYILGTALLGIFTFITTLHNQLISVIARPFYGCIIIGIGASLAFTTLMYYFIVLNSYFIREYSLIFASTSVLYFLVRIATTGLGTFIQHYTLRHMLANGGHLPRWRYDKFLDYAAQDLLILRKVGGGYRFTHDYLRQHLAASPR
jgi:hypothetical protein